MPELKQNFQDRNIGAYSRKANSDTIEFVNQVN